jgi:serine/threonine protein kinase
VYGGIGAGVVAVLLLVVGFILYRRRQARRDKTTEMPPSSSHPSTALTYGMPPSGSTKANTSRTHGTESVTAPGSHPPSSGSGYLTNDVRNDESLVPYRLPVDEIEVVRELAMGGFGVVSLATMRHDKRLVVVKRLKGNGNSEALRRFMGEIHLCARLDHPKIVRFVGVAWTTLLDLSLVLEFMPRGDLSGLLKHKQKPWASPTKARRRSNSPNDERYHEYDSDSSEEGTSFSWFDPRSKPRAKIDLALDVTEAVVYLHSFSAPIIHRDLKSKNVLLSETFEAKLSDFGVSRERKGGGLDDDSDVSTMTGGMGTTAWIAPEVLQGERYSEKADLFSLGIVLAELDACGHPYNNVHSERKLTDAKIALLVSSDALKPSLSPDCPPGVRRLLLRCVSFDPRERPNAVELHYELRKLKAAAQRQLSSSSSTLASSYHQGFV